MKKHHILVVEDNIPDIVLAQKALATLPSVEVSVALGVTEALAFLDMLTADLILLDLNLPKVSGMELLRAAPSQRWSHVPIVVVTSSAAEDDVRQAYRLGARGYLTKPLTLQQYKEMVATLGAYWFDVCRLPSR